MHIKNQHEIASMREGGKILATILKKLGEITKPGITTRELDQQAEQMMKEFGVKPSFKGYHGYPAVTCISINEEVVHTIPNDRVVKEGDLVKIDCGVIVNNLHTDAARQILVGQTGPALEHFTQTVEKALYAGIAQAKHGNTVYEISRAVQTIVEQEGYGIVRELTGHGIGYKLHEEPHVPNFKEPFGKKIQLSAGMTIAIEPIVTMGKPQIKTLKDGWTIVTIDNSIASQSEHTILITENEPEILTLL